MPEQIDQLYSSYDRNLYRITGDEQDDAIWNMIQSSQSSGSTGTTMVIGGGGLGDSSVDPSTTVVAVGSIQSGKKTFDNVTPGYILGFDPKDGKAKFYIGNSSQYLNFDGTTLSVAGDFLIGSSNLTIGTTDDIQTAINQLNTAGGGQLYLQQGTYIVTSSLTLYSNVSIFGQSPSDTTIVLTNGAQMTMTGTGIYTTGTISSISGGVNVTGSGTTWTSAMIGQQIFINNRWYVISNVTSTTTLVLATGYADGTTFSGTYRIVSPIHDVEIKNITVTGSSATALTGTDVRDITFYGMVFASNSKGFSLTNFMDIEVTILTCASNTSNGYELTNGSFFNASQLASVSNGGHGAVINTMKSLGIIFSACDANTNDGFNLKTVTNSVFKVETSGNGANGIQLVSGCTYNFVNDSLVQNNTSNGIKLTASSSNNTFGSSIAISGNGAWGILIADNTSSGNAVIAPSYSSNSSGNLSDSGSSTNVIQVVPSPKFGGTGADGALSITSGTTTINLGGATFFIKNYSSISITGTGTLAFSNPGPNGTLVSLRSQGAVTLTSSSVPMLDLSGMGGPGGSGGTAGGGGGSGTSGMVNFGTSPSFGGGGPTFAGSTQGTAGAAPSDVNGFNSLYIYKGGIFFGTGAGGGGGGAGNSGGGATGGAGGAGGGALVIECNGALNFTTANGISVAGITGGSGSNGGGNVGGRGGSGGGGGTCIVLYNSLTSASGTINAAGGSGGSPGSGASGTASAGAGSGAGALQAGTIGLSASGSAVAGVSGGNGFSIVQLNTEFT